MTKRDRAKMRDRLVKLLAASVPKVLQVSDVVDFVAREVDRAVRAEREMRNVCHDCKVVMFDEGPPLCEGCVSVRDEEGMGRDDNRTIHTWRRT